MKAAQNILPPRFPWKNDEKLKIIKNIHLEIQAINITRTDNNQHFFFPSKGMFTEKLLLRRSQKFIFKS